MLFGTRQKLEQCSGHRVQLHGKEIERVSSFCYLGITLDENLLWNEFIELICDKVSKRLGLLFRIRPFLHLIAANNVYNNLQQPMFDHTDPRCGVGCQSDSVTAYNVYETGQHI